MGGGDGGANDGGNKLGGGGDVFKRRLLSGIQLLLERVSNELQLRSGGDLRARGETSAKAPGAEGAAVSGG